jgi:hypothetical protein
LVLVAITNGLVVETIAATWFDDGGDAILGTMLGFSEGFHVFLLCRCWGLVEGVLDVLIKTSVSMMVSYIANEPFRSLRAGKLGWNNRVRGRARIISNIGVHSIACRHASTQGLGPWQFVEMPETKNLQKSFGGSVEKRSAEFFRTTRDSYEVALQKLPKNFARLHSADRFDLRPEDRLSVRNDGQGFHGRRRQTNLAVRGVKPPQPRGEFRSRHQLKTACYLLHAKRTSMSIVSPIQGLD